ncbi:MAG: hypothetical protein JNJ61_23810, partial [Anaerolineae bacterium]|nr:hypothetical protein [Anaerolineae bacterium]
MNTSAEATKQLQQALVSTREAAKIIENLIVAHDYQDVAGLVAQAAAELLETAAALMQSQDEPALTHLEQADDLLDAVWDIIDAET